MYDFLEAVSGRPWAIHGDIAAHVRGALLTDGFAGLRRFAELKAAAHANDPHADRGAEASFFADSGGTGGPVAVAASARGDGRRVLGVVPVIGMLTQRGKEINSVMTRSTASVAEQVRMLAAEPSVDAIVLEVDSPGGEVFGVPEAWAAIRDARTAKPVVAAVNSWAASAAFYLASAADRIVLTPSGLVGSIGVYMLHIDRSKALEAEGLKTSFVSAGKFKVEGNDTEPLGDEARMAMQSEVDRYYGDFVRDVARGRSTDGRTVSVDAVRNGYGEGRLVGAKAAFEQGMVDEVGTLEQAMRRAMQLGRERRSAATAGAQRASAEARLRAM